MKFKTLFALSASLAVISCAGGGLTQQGGTRAISQSAAQQAAQQHPQVVQQFGGADRQSRVHRLMLADQSRVQSLRPPAPLHGEGCAFGVDRDVTNIRGSNYVHGRVQL